MSESNSEEQQEPGSTEDFSGASSVHSYLADAAMALLRCQSNDDVYEVMADFITQIVPGAVVVINEITPDLEWLITRKVIGLDDSLLAKAAAIAGFELVGKQSAVVPTYRDQMLAGTLARVPGGFVEFASSETPRAAAKVLAKMLGITDVLTIGIADGGGALGNAHIFMRASGVTVPSPIIETFVRHCYSVLAGIAERRELAESEDQARKSQLLLKASLESQQGTVLFSIDREYRYLYFNTAHADAMRRAYGQEVELGMCVLDCITSDADRAAAKANYDRALKGESHGNIRAFGDHDPVYFESFFNPIFDNDGEIFGATGLARDISGRMQAEQALIETRDALIGLTNQVPGVVYVYRLYPDGSSAFPFSSRGMNDIYEYSPEEVQADATPVFGRLHPDDYDYVADAIQESARTLKPFHVEFRVVLPRQGLRWRVSDALPQRMEDGGTSWYGIIQDDTERKTAEERLGRYHAHIRALNAELVVSEQRERNRLGVELHDGVGQLLSAAKMSAQLLATEPLETSAKEQAEKLVALLGESISEVRHLTSELAPTVLFELGLRSSLLWLRDRYSQLYGLRCTVRVDRHAAQSRADVTMFVFRVAREALNNVVRHSHVDRAILTVRKSDGWMTVIIRDSGAGFDTALVDEPGETGGFGLFSIREECLGMGGTMEIESQPGKGTRIKVRVPDEAVE